jgi:Uma2 family endonuclease
MTTLLPVQPPSGLDLLDNYALETWQLASWETFVTIADDEKSAKLKGYYYNGRMRFEPMSTGADHSRDHAIILFAISFFVAQFGIMANGHDACSYRKLGLDEFQPDISYYVGQTAGAIPWGTRVVNLEDYPVPSLVIEISDTSLADDLGTKRLQYEELGIPEYWIVNVQTMRIVGFAIAADGSTRRIQESVVLSGLRLGILEQALERSRQENQSTTTAWLMQQLQA